MIEFPNGGHMIENVAELPNLRGARRLFLDFETKSGDKSVKSVNPWHNCWVAGFAITVDRAPGAWYVPLGHYRGHNIEEWDRVVDWLFDVVGDCSEWVNHNIKYDAHVMANCMGIVVDESLTMIDTVARAKLLDSDRQFKGGYGLDALSDYWLREDISQYEQAMKPYLFKNKDYGWIPSDVMAPYACQDVITNRRLIDYLEAQMPEQCHRVQATETALTSVLFEQERIGMRVDPQQLKVQELRNLNKLFDIDQRLAKLVGRSFRPHVSEDCYDVICNQYGMPVLKWTEEYDEETGEQPGNPSFDKYAMASYMLHPYAPHEVISLISEYRKINTFNNNFVCKYSSIVTDDCMLHPSYNQLVRTGRMSCKDPNMHQLDKAAKALIFPHEGCTFLSIDYAQIEFRTIVHYIRDEEAIAAFARDPDTDFHQWVADQCGIKRRAAKTVNFMIAFGGGKKKTIATLSGNMDVVGDIKQKVDHAIEIGTITQAEAVGYHKLLCERKGTQVYDDYHGRFPGIKYHSKHAANAAKSRGYVFNLYGRRRHLPVDHSHIAFNTLNQSSAADILKERTVALHKALKGTPIWIEANVHDETLLDGPTEAMRDPRTVRDAIALLESPAIDLRVPVRTAYGLSDVNWREASAGEEKLKYAKEDFGNFEHLK